ncbi:phosphatidate cytidylyltransferase [Rickettsiales endosymbiont of Trichoplax sp. H2]|uniref:phosphatidate cytidylyltransferase n=1 Tax=Rickettsiales endosymbiont of Trichoplax sp. H2 TaxID=2021221 RepID=UPI0012B33218|nr:phosphatidate cytidylyltransferase [Rickettsiales endosymbiont of Trichoplax sp. H2]MSO13594.1 Phosphatidate cytidylyltransferase [Rickettsiales endosymbiont of Trichoplax sp. H2]
MVSKILNNNLFKRVITALVLIPIVLYIIMEGGVLFDSFLGLIFIISTYEVIMIVNNDKKISLLKKMTWIFPILIYIGFSMISLRYIRLYDEGYFKIMILLLSIWVFDSAAYFAGVLIGGPKLCPKISPKKTWAGLIGGIVITFFIPNIVAIIMLKHIFLSAFAIIFGFYLSLLGIIGQVGDLMESYFKRKFSVKDSGNIIPGHGGVLDRMDSIFLASIFFYLLLRFK